MKVLVLPALCCGAGRLPTDPSDPELADALQAADFRGAPPAAAVPLSERRRRLLGRRLKQVSRQPWQATVAMKALPKQVNRVE